MKAKLIFENLGTLLDFIVIHAKKVSFGKLNAKKVFTLTTTEEEGGIGLEIRPKDTEEEAETLFYKVIEQAQKAVGFVRVEQTGTKKNTNEI